MYTREVYPMNTYKILPNAVLYFILKKISMGESLILRQRIPTFSFDWGKRRYELPKKIINLIATLFLIAFSLFPQGKYILSLARWKSDI